MVAVGLDLMATCCDFAGVAAPPHCLGVSLREAAEGGPSHPPTRSHVYGENGGEWGRSDMLVTERWKLVQYDGGADAEQLFDLKEDPGETHNHVGGNELVLAELREALDMERAAHTALVL